MDESQEVPELPTKKARHDPELSQESDSRIMVANDNSNPTNQSDSTALESEVNSYPPSSVTHLHTTVTCKDLTTTTATEYTSQIYQGSNNPAVTAYAGQVAFPSLGQSSMYSGFPQSSQTYGLPPFDHIDPHFKLHPVLNRLLITSFNSASFSPSLALSCSISLCMASGTMWPGLKTESRLPEAPSVGQTGFLGFSSGYTSTQPSQIHYTYPSQGKPATALSLPPIGSSTRSLQPTALSLWESKDPPRSIYLKPLPLTLTAFYLVVLIITIRFTTATATHQDFTNYNTLGQSQFSQYYVPPPSYLSAGLPSNDRDGAGVVAPGYPAIKTEGSASADLPNTTDESPGETLPTGVALPTGMALPTGARDQDEPNRKNPAGKAKGKAKKSDSSQPTDNDLERVFLWDLDETIIIFHSLLTGSFAQKFGKDPATVLNLGLQMEELIFELADTHLFFNDLEECDQVHVDDVASDDNGQDLSNYNFSSDGFTGPNAGGGQGSTIAVQGGVDWMRKLAFRYRRLKEIYNGFKGNVGGLLSPMKRDLLHRLRSDIENVTDAWLSTALKSLLLIQSRGKCMNVLVTTTQLVPALAKVLLYGLADVFPIENIYSATKIGKESCFERIISRFGKKVTYVVIGDGRDEEFAAKQHNIPFWRISSHGDLISLHQALELDFL
ncbi:Eyes absent -like protein 3 [Triplophysa tibetana]|uniref:Eyes absent homolog n=1 Tax=Triplophysa tibetana TaxID=1572043 RepID=A0A5A9NNM6_9TELE|nr:Eyes absent -like protein 3 [Triplophysa tibetana]